MKKAPLVVVSSCALLLLVASNLVVPALGATLTVGSDLVSNFRTAALLSNQVYAMTTREDVSSLLRVNISSFSYDRRGQLSDGNAVDAWIGALVGNDCFIVFKGTQGGALEEDWAENVSTKYAFVTDTCAIGMGFFTAAFSKTTVFDWAQGCMSEAPGRRLIYTGHSQGGAAAVTAATLFGANPYQPDFLDKPDDEPIITNVRSESFISSHGALFAAKPIVITFGAPRTIDIITSACPVESNNHFRFVNVGPRADVSVYDPVTFLNAPAIHKGHEIFLSDSRGSVFYNGLDTSTFRVTSTTYTAPHSMVQYKDRILALPTSSQTFDKFANNAICGDNAECPIACLDKNTPTLDMRCTDGKVGSHCYEDNHCIDKRCEDVPFLSIGTAGTCKAKLGLDAICKEANDCQSGLICAGQGLWGAFDGVCSDRSNGKKCSGDNECLSGRCDDTCMAKLGSCSACNENSDCSSNNCILRSTQMACARNDGKMDDGCYCDFDSHCNSGRCEGSWPPYKCYARLGAGSSCNENSDCISNSCSGWFSPKCK